MSSQGHYRHSHQGGQYYYDSERIKRNKFLNKQRLQHDENVSYGYDADRRYQLKADDLHFDESFPIRVVSDSHAFSDNPGEHFSSWDCEPSSSGRNDQNVAFDQLDLLSSIRSASPIVPRRKSSRQRNTRGSPSSRGVKYTTTRPPHNPEVRRDSTADLVATSELLPQSQHYGEWPPDYAAMQFTSERKSRR